MLYEWLVSQGIYPINSVNNFNCQFDILFIKLTINMIQIFTIISNAKSFNIIKYWEIIDYKFSGILGSFISLYLNVFIVYYMYL